MNRADRRRYAKQLTNASADERRALAEHFASLYPLHIRDQVDAAAGDVARRMPQAAQARGTEFVQREVSPRLQARIDLLAVTFLSGDGIECPHLSSPQPVSVLLWEDPPRLRCGVCVADVEPLDPAGAEDRTCDLCRTFDPEGIHGTTVAVGPMTVSLGACDRCYADLMGRP